MEGGSLPKSKELPNKHLSFSHPCWSSLSSPVSDWPDLASIHEHMFLMTVLFCNQIPVLSLESKLLRLWHKSESSRGSLKCIVCWAPLPESLT